MLLGLLTLEGVEISLTQQVVRAETLVDLIKSLPNSVCLPLTYSPGDPAKPAGDAQSVSVSGEGLPSDPRAKRRINNNFSLW